MDFPSGWSPWHPLGGALADPQLRNGAGAYVIRVRDRPLHRAVGVDELGILDIGESGRLKKRVSSFLKCARAEGPDVSGHMAGWRYCYLGFARHFPITALDIRWLNLDSKAAAYAEEGRLLRQYVEKHLELPPLNYKFNWPQ